MRCCSASPRNDELTATGEVLWSGHGTLPGTDGWRITETLRAEGIETPIVIVSARGSETSANVPLTNVFPLARTADGATGVDLFTSS